MIGRVYAIDPGINGTGWAFWEGDRRRPQAVGVIPAVRHAADDPLANVCRQVARSVKTVIALSGGLDKGVHVYIEMPMMMTNAAGIAAQKGAVYKLTFLVGYISCIVHPCAVFEVQPRQWKGQLPKSIVEDRIRTTLGSRVCKQLNIRTHAWDAVGLGLWANGVWR